METIEDLDADIIDLHAQIADLQARRANLGAILLSQPHLAARLQKSNTRDKTAELVQDTFREQSRINEENVHRICAGVTASKVIDPDPHAVNGGNILAINVDLVLAGKLVDSYHVFLNFTDRNGTKIWKIHKHTVPTCIPLQQLVNKFLPKKGKDEEAEDPEPRLYQFGRELRHELASWHMRLQAVVALRKAAGLKSQQPAEAQDVNLENTGKVLNAFVSDDESSDDEMEESQEDVVRIVDIEADAAVREITITWSDKRTAVMIVSKDGQIEKATCRTKDGDRDQAVARKAIGPIDGLLTRLSR